MKLVIEMDLDNAAFDADGGGADEVGRILATIAERIPDPPALTNGAYSLHDCNGNWVGDFRIMKGSVKRR